jgi:branched-chain amino acid transport system permease protein
LELFVASLLSGINNGVIYGFLALALVCTYRGSRTLNLAQGEMAMFCAFLAYQFVKFGLPVLAAIALTVLVGACGGALIERTLIRPLGHDSEYSALLVTIGLFLAINATAGVIWGGDPLSFPSVVPSGPHSHISILGARWQYQQLLIVGVLLAVVTGLYALFRYTWLGLAMRVASSNPDSARLLGIRVHRMSALGWALAAGIGALLAPLIAPGTTVTTGMFFNYMIYAAAAATLGGFDSPVGAVLGGLIIGVVENMVAGYVSFIGDSLKLAVALVILLGVLMVRPTGLLGTRRVERV